MANFNKNRLLSLENSNCVCYNYKRNIMRGSGDLHSPCAYMLREIIKNSRKEHK